MTAARRNPWFDRVVEAAIVTAIQLSFTFAVRLVLGVAPLGVIVTVAISLLLTVATAVVVVIGVQARRVSMIVGVLVFLAATLIGVWRPHSPLLAGLLALTAAVGVMVMAPLPPWRRVKRVLRSGVSRVAVLISVTAVLFTVFGAAWGLRQIGSNDNPVPTTPTSSTTPPSTAPPPRTTPTTASPPPTRTTAAPATTSAPSVCDPGSVRRALVADLGPVVGASAATIYGETRSPGCPDSPTAPVEVLGRQAVIRLSGAVQGNVAIVVNDVGEGAFVRSQFVDSVLKSLERGGVVRVSKIVDAHGATAYQTDVSAGCSLLWQATSASEVVDIGSRFAPSLGYLSQRFKQLPALVTSDGEADTVGLVYSSNGGPAIRLTLGGDVVPSRHRSLMHSAKAARTCLLPNEWATFTPAPAGSS